MKLVLFTLWSLLHITSQNPLNHWTLKHNGDWTSGPVFPALFPLSRDVWDESDIFWRINGEKIQSTGNIHVVELHESNGGGNYSCHSKDGALLNHTKVLLHECFSLNYNGKFHCSWTWDPSRVGKVVFIKVWRPSDNHHDLHCSGDSSGQQWTCRSSWGNISCSVDLGGNRVSCIDKQHCPYAEEVQFIRITVFVANRFLLENYSKHFYLSEIVKPGKVQISKVNRTAIEWMYPSSWDSPHSYFPLTFQIAQFGRTTVCDVVKPNRIVTVNCTENCSSKIKRNTRTVCFRAKDALSNSEWSEWSPERAIKQRKKRKRKEAGSEQRKGGERVRDCAKVRFDVWHPRQHPEEWE
ncbi:hypothetical protein WMY93_009478 [Mugilogobius chulae]|uniref:Interleukin-12 subunit beta n=1 Tax=Mugilogobius chulae TaxID=88201 RepID=A0AAW0PBW2_9GOBI